MRAQSALKSGNIVSLTESEEEIERLIEHPDRSCPADGMESVKERPNPWSTTLGAPALTSESMGKGWKLSRPSNT